MLYAQKHQYGQQLSTLMASPVIRNTLKAALLLGSVFITQVTVADEDSGKLASTPNYAVGELSEQGE